MTKKGYSNNELIFIISHLLSLLTNGNHKEHKKTKQELPKKPKMTFLNHKFLPNGRIKKIYRNFKHHKTLSSSEARYSYNNRRNRKYS